MMFTGTELGVQILTKPGTASHDSARNPLSKRLSAVTKGIAQEIPDTADSGAYGTRF
jgi:hypothetical protein